MMLRGERADGEAEKGCLEWIFFRVPDLRGKAWSEMTSRTLREPSGTGDD